MKLIMATGAIMKSEVLVLMKYHRNFNFKFLVTMILKTKSRDLMKIPGTSLVTA